MEGQENRQMIRVEMAKRKERRVNLMPLKQRRKNNRAKRDSSVASTPFDLS